MAGPTGKNEEESKPIALSIFEFDFGRHCPEEVLHHKLSSSGLQRNMDNNNNLFTYIARVTCADAHTRVTV